MDLLNTVHVMQIILGSLSFIVAVVGIRIHQYNSAMVKCNAIAEMAGKVADQTELTKHRHFHSN